VNKLLRVGISAVLLGWVAWKMDWTKLAEVFAGLRLEFWLAGVGLFALAQTVSSQRWQIITRALGFNETMGQLTRFYFIGTYFSLLLPTSVGGDVVRAWYLDNRSGRRLKAFLSVFLDRLSGLMVLLAMGCLAAVFSPMPEAWIAWSIWAHVVHHYPYDISWGGPHWVHAAHSPSLTWPQLAGVFAILATGVAIFFAYRLDFGKRGWAAIRSKT